MNPTTPTRRRLLPWLATAGVVAALAAFFALLPTPPADGEGTAAEPAGEAAAELPSGSFAVTGVRLFDGERVLPRADVLVEDGRIAAVGADSRPAGRACPSSTATAAPCCPA